MSAGGWAAVRALRPRGNPTPADARILGSGAFVDRLLTETAAATRQTLRIARPRPSLEASARHLGYPGAAVARFLGGSTSAVHRAAWAAPVPGLGQLLGSIGCSGTNVPESASRRA